MTLAIFDLDDTLIDGDCASLWCREMARQGWVDGESFLRQESEMMAEYALGTLALEDYMDLTLEPLVGRTLEEVDYLVGPFVEDTIEPLIHGDAMRCVASHRERGHRILVISASARFLVTAIAERLGIDEVLAVDVEVRDGLLSGRTEGVLTYRGGKVERLRQWLDRAGERLEDAWFYSDSNNDMPLLSLVGHPHAVNPDPILAAEADRNGWPVLRWR